MKYRRLGKTNLKVSVIGIGTWQFGGEWGKTFAQEEVNAILAKAKDVGINLIDTAECYGDHLSEKLIGGYLRGANRHEWIIATKFGHRFIDLFRREEQWTAEAVIRQLEESLKALGTDYIDLYQFHSGNDEAFRNDDLWTALDKQVQAGKIRHLGLSLRKKDNLFQAESASKVKAETIQVVYNRLEREAEENVLPACERQDLGVLARVPLASGFLSGKYKPGAAFAENDVRHRSGQEEVAETLRLVEEIRQNEVPENMNMAHWALAWCLKHPAVTCVIPGCKSVEQVEANAASVQYVSDNHPQAWKG
jgi:aryl-alcohol dehydrogenase-like predicted oxidoreductase